MCNSVPPKSFGWPIPRGTDFNSTQPATAYASGVDPSLTNAGALPGGGPAAIPTPGTPTQNPYGLPGGLPSVNPIIRSLGGIPGMPTSPYLAKLAF